MEEQLVEDFENQPTSSSSRMEKGVYSSSSSLSLEEKMTEEGKDKPREKRPKRNSFRSIFKKDDPENKDNRKKTSSSKPESLVRTFSGMFAGGKEIHSTTTDNSDNDKYLRPIPRQSNDNENKSKRRSYLFLSDNEEEPELPKKEKHRSNSNDLPHFDNENSSSKSRKHKNRLSFNFDKILDSHKQKSNSLNNNNLTDLFLPDTDSPIKTYKGRHDSSEREHAVPYKQVFDPSHQADSPVAILNNVPTSSTVNKLSNEKIPTQPIHGGASTVPAIDIYVDQDYYSSASATSINEEEIEEQQVSSSIDEYKDDDVNDETGEPINNSSVSSVASLLTVNTNTEQIHLDQERTHDENLTPATSTSETETEHYSSSTTPPKTEEIHLDQERAHDEQNLTPATTISETETEHYSSSITPLTSSASLMAPPFFLNIKTKEIHLDQKRAQDEHEQNLTPATTTSETETEHYSSSTTPSASPVSPVTPLFIVNTKTEQIYLDQECAHNEHEQKVHEIVKHEKIYHIERATETIPIIENPLPQIIEKRIIITKEDSQTRHKLEQLQATNETLATAKEQLETKVREQSQQISKLSSLEAVMVRQLELAEKMEETMRRLESEVNHQKEEMESMFSERIEYTIKRLENKVNEQNKELEGFRSFVGQLQDTNSLQLILEQTYVPIKALQTSDHQTSLSQSSTSIPKSNMSLTTHQTYTRHTLVDTLVVKPLVNTITVSATIATSVLYALYVRPAIGLFKIVRYGM